MSRSLPTSPRSSIKIGEMSRRCGVTQRALRYYEELGLLAPTRANGGVRLYDEADVARVRRIVRRRERGETLGSILLSETGGKMAGSVAERAAVKPAQPPRAGRGGAAAAPRDGYVKIGDMARFLGTTVRTLRYYEDEGIITAAKSQGGTRYYAVDEIDACRTALTLSRLGLGLDLVKRLACGRKRCATGDEAARRMLEVLDDVRAYATERLALFARLAEDLDLVGGFVRACEGCRNRPDRYGCPDCPMERNRDRSELARLIWDRSPLRDE